MYSKARVALDKLESIWIHHPNDGGIDKLVKYYDGVGKSIMKKNSSRWINDDNEKPEAWEEDDGDEEVSGDFKPEWMS